MAEVWFSVLFYETFKAFMEAQIYTLFKVTTTRIKIFTAIFVFKNLSGSEKKW